MSDEKAARELLDMMLAPVRSYCVYAAAKLGIADELQDGPRSTAALADSTGTHPDALGRLMRMLGALRITESDESGHRLGPLGELLVTDGDGSMRDLALCYTEQFYPPFARIVHSLRTGEQSFPDVFGSPVFEYYTENPEAGSHFDAAMSAGTTFFRSVPSAFDFSSARHVVDVAGGRGALLAIILEQHPQLRGTLAEVPRLVEPARDYLRDRGLTERCEVVATDIFADVPERADIYLLSRILHDWDDERCHTLLRAIRSAAAPGASLLVIERVLPAGTEPALAIDFDMHMLVNAGGRERSIAEYDGLFEATGFVRQNTASLHLEVQMQVATAV